MKNLRKILVVLLAVITALTLAAAVFAEGGDAADGTTLTTGAETAAATAAPASNKTVNFLSVTDENGKDMLASSGLGCLGSGVTFYIKHEYTIVLGYYENGETKPTDDQLILGITGGDGKATYEHNTIKLAKADKPYTFSLRYVRTDGEEGEAVQSFKVSRFKMDIADLVVAAIGVYVIICVFRGGGALFDYAFIKEDKLALFKKLALTLSLIAGVVFIVSAVLAICFSYLSWVKIARYVLFGVGASSLIALTVLNTVFTDKEKREKAQQTQRTGGGNPSKAAFEFDGSEPTLDEVLAEKEKAVKDEKDGE